VSWLIAICIAVVAVVRAIRSPVLKPPAYRVLFLLVVIGVVLVSVLPEATFIIPAIDAVGLDIVTILVALELSHYLISACRMLGIPRIAVVYRSAPAQIMSRCRHAIPTNPLLSFYACLWLVIAGRTLLGAIRGPPRA
jgi:hypothetical protein